MRNLLTVTAYKPVLRDQLVEMIIEKMLLMDVEIEIDDDDDDEDDDDDDDEEDEDDDDRLNGDSEVFGMDDFPDASASEPSTSAPPTPRRPLSDMAEKLDELMCMVSR